MSYPNPCRNMAFADNYHMQEVFNTISFMEGTAATEWKAQNITHKRIVGELLKPETWEAEVKGLRKEQVEQRCSHRTGLSRKDPHSKNRLHGRADRLTDFISLA